MGTAPQGERAGLPAARRLAQGLVRTPPGLARAAALVWLLVIFLLSEVPGRPGGGTLFWSVAFNFGHAVLYGCLAVWALLGLPAPARAGLPPGVRLAAVAAVGACGLLDEVHQRFVPGRDFSVLDLGTDLVGATGALLVLAYLQRGDARPAGLWSRILVAILAAAGAAVAATFLPAHLPRYDWL